MSARAREHAHGHEHVHAHRTADARSLRIALTLIALFMAGEVVAAMLASSLALLSDAAHMLTDAVALAVSLLAARLALRPAAGSMTYGLARAEILSAEANGVTMLVLAALIVYGAVVRLVSPAEVHGGVVLAVSVAGIVVNLLITRVLGRHDHPRSLNVEGSYQHILNDLYGFIATAIAAVVILATGFDRADAIASLLIAGLMLRSGIELVRASVRVMMEAAPAGLDPELIGRTLAQQSGVAEVHDLHVWEVTSGFPALSAHVIVEADCDCHELRRSLSRLLAERFEIGHSTLQVEHGRADQPPLQIEVVTPGVDSPAR